MTKNTIEQSLKVIKSLKPRKDNYISTEIRQRLEAKGIQIKPRAMGALMRKAVNEGILQPTGYERYREKSRMTTEYTPVSAAA